MALVRHFSELRVYQQAFEAAMRIYGLSNHWPAEERYSLTDQIRRSSRSICGSIAEAWKKRQYPNHFSSKLSDADSEAAETQNWLKFASTCGHLRQEDFQDLWQQYEQISASLARMMSEPDTWCGYGRAVREPEMDYVVSTEPA